MKNVLKKFIILTIVLSTLFNNINAVFCDDNKTVTIEYVIKAKVTFIDDLTHEEFFQEHNIGDKLIEPEHSDNSNYKFLGWYNGDVKWDFENDVIENHLTLHGKYKKRIIPSPIHDFPKTGIDKIDNLIKAIETKNSFNTFICILLVLLIIVVLYIILSKDKDDEDNNKFNILKHIKKIFIIMICSMCVLSPSNVRAEEDDENTTVATEDGNYIVKLIAEVASVTYEIVVPAEIDLNQEESFDVLGKADFFLYNNKPIQDLIITVENKVTLKNTTDKAFTFDTTTVSTLKEYYTNTDINPMNAVEYSNLGNISFELPDTFIAAGAYKGILTFTYTLRNVENE